jgi:hypothetical protein
MALTQITDNHVQYSANEFPRRIWLQNGARFGGTPGKRYISREGVLLAFQRKTPGGEPSPGTHGLYQIRVCHMHACAFMFQIA